MALVDRAISDNSHQTEILRSIHVALLCTQELPKDRPSTATIISMLLNSEIVDLPSPKKPAFTVPQMAPDIGSSNQSDDGPRSINHVTITTMEGR